MKGRCRQAEYLTLLKSKNALTMGSFGYVYLRPFCDDGDIDKWLTDGPFPSVTWDLFPVLRYSINRGYHPVVRCKFRVKLCVCWQTGSNVVCVGLQEDN